MTRMRRVLVSMLVSVGVVLLGRAAAKRPPAPSVPMVAKTNHQCRRQSASGPVTLVAGTGKFCVLQVWQGTERIPEHALHSFAINRAYAKSHGYTFVVVRGLQHSEPMDRLNWWNADKVAALQRLLQDDSPCDWVFYIDADAAIIDFSRTIEKILELGEKKESDVITAGYPNLPDGTPPACASRGEPCAVNGGVFLIRRSPWSRKFADLWWDNAVAAAEKNECSALEEQCVWQRMIDDPASGVWDHTTFLPPAQLNRADEPGPSLFMLHLWGTRDETERSTALKSLGEGKLPTSYSLKSDSPPSDVESARAMNAAQFMECSLTTEDGPHV